MKIVMVADHCCIRVFKEAYELLHGRGHDMYLVSHKEGTGWNLYNLALFFWYEGAFPKTDNDKTMFRRAIKHMAETIKPDIFHIHNEPDWIATETIRVLKDIKSPAKVVWDIHDPESARLNAVPTEELELMRNVDGIVYVSHEEREWMEWAHPVAAAKPNCTIFSCFPSRVLAEPYMKLADYRIPNSIVFQGGISEPNIMKRHKMREETQSGRAVQYYNMRDLANIVEAFCKEGYNFHLYGANTDPGKILPEADMYRQFGAIAEPSANPFTIIPELSKYEFGFVGFPMKAELFEMAMPNKLFDYLCAGTIPVVINCKAAGEFVRKHNIGIWFDGDEWSVPGTLKQLLTGVDTKTLRENIKKILPMFLMDAQVHKLENLYEEVLCGGTDKQQTDTGGDFKHAPARRRNRGGSGCGLRKDTGDRIHRRGRNTAHRVVGASGIPETGGGENNTALGWERYFPVPDPAEMGADGNKKQG